MKHFEEKHNEKVKMQNDSKKSTADMINHGENGELTFSKPEAQPAA